MSNYLFLTRRALTVMLCVALPGFVLAPRANADAWNKKTIVSFSGPVEVPGKVLPAGTYVFKLLDSPSNRNIVQVFNPDETRLYATILAVPDYRPTPTGDTVIRFEERAAGAPQAVSAWFYPGEQYGQHFVPRKSGPVDVASQMSQRASSTPSQTEANISGPAGAPEGKTEAETAAKTPERSSEQVEVAQAVPPKPETSASSPPSTGAQSEPPAPAAETTPEGGLPQTGSELPLVASAGLLSLGGAALVRLLAKRGQ